MEQYKNDMKVVYEEVFKIWKNSIVKESVEKIFLLLTGMNFKFVFQHLGKI